LQDLLFTKIKRLQKKKEGDVEMKAILMSIRPKWVEMIASGKKTVEVRRTKPKIDVPFKCYIYCTKGDWLTSVNGKVQKPNNMVIDISSDSKIEELNGKVIGEFVCDKVDGFTYFENCVTPQMVNVGIEGRLTLDELAKYFKGNSDGYAWHITDLVIYDQPKELSEFWTIKCTNKKVGCSQCYIKPNCITPITRPPQSWCYCKELKGEGKYESRYF
jgi:predicted transcriptional regulator